MRFKEYIHTPFVWFFLNINYIAFYYERYFHNHNQTSHLHILKFISYLSSTYNKHGIWIRKGKQWKEKNCKFLARILQKYLQYTLFIFLIYKIAILRNTGVTFWNSLRFRQNPDGKWRGIDPHKSNLSRKISIECWIILIRMDSKR